MGVACLNVQSGASGQGYDLEHTGHASFSHGQRQPARLTSSVCAQAMGDLECFFSEDAAPVLLDKGPHAETNLWPCSELDWLATGGLRVGGLNCLLNSMVNGRILPMAGNGYLFRHVVSFLQLLRLVRPRILKSFSPSYFMG